MAAQEYYQNPQGNGQAPAPARTSTPQAPTGPPPGRAPQALQVPVVNPPYPLYDGPPPPYSPGERSNSQPPPRRPSSMTEYAPEKPQQQSVQGQPAPPQRQERPPSYPSSSYSQSPRIQPPQQADYDAQFRPPVRQQHSYNYPEEKRNGQGPAPYQPGYYGAQPVQPPYQNGYANGSTNNVSFAPNPQYRPRSRSRSRSRERRKHQQQKKKSSGLGTFLGAGGGALIGDAIFPGLGTIGGAILGGFGGHEYGKQKGKDTRHRDRRYSDDYEYRPSSRRT